MNVSRFWVPAVVSAALFMVASCAAAPVAVYKAPSGKAEATVANASLASTRAAVMSFMLDDGYILTLASERSMRFDRIYTGPAALLYGSRINPTPWLRVTYTILPAGTDTMVFGDIQMITNPATVSEIFTDWNHSKESLDVQTALDRLKAVAPAAIEGTPRPTPPARVI